MYTSATLESDRVAADKVATVISGVSNFKSEHPVIVTPASRHEVTRAWRSGDRRAVVPELKDKLDATLQRVQTGWTPQVEAPKTQARCLRPSGW